MKRCVLLLMNIFMLSFCFGCSKNVNSTPENVALEMAKVLSKGNYEKVDELFDTEEVFVDSGAFEEYLNKNNLNIKGNKKIEIKKDESTNNNTLKQIEIKIDNNKILRVNTIKKNDKWYVKLDNYNYDNNLTFVVPKGATIKLNNKKLDFDKYGETKEEQRSATSGQTYKYNVEMDTYVLPYVFSGEYNLTIEGKNIETVNTTITSRRSNYKDAKNEEDIVFIENSTKYILLPKASKNIKDAINKQLTEYYNSLFTSINNDKDYIELNSYFDSSNKDTISKLEKEYNELKSSKIDRVSYREKLYSEFSLDKLEYFNKYGIYYYDDEHIIVILTNTMKYRYIFNYIGSMASMNDSFHEDEYETKTNKTILKLKKQDNKYIIVDGTTFVPSL